MQPALFDATEPGVGRILLHMFARIRALWDQLRPSPALAAHGHGRRPPAHAAHARPQLDASRAGGQIVDPPILTPPPRSPMFGKTPEQTLGRLHLTSPHVMSGAIIVGTSEAARQLITEASRSDAYRVVVAAPAPLSRV